MTKVAVPGTIHIFSVRRQLFVDLQAGAVMDDEQHAVADACGARRTRREKPPHIIPRQHLGMEVPQAS